MIVAVPPNSLSPKDKEKLTKKGYTVIEMDNPDSIRLIESENAPMEAYYISALDALRQAGSPDCKRFVETLYEALLKSKEKQLIKQ